MRKVSAMLLLVFAGILSLFCFAACGNDGANNGGDDTEYIPTKDSHLLKEGKKVCEHCGKQLFKGELKFTLSQNKKYYEASDFYDVEGDVIVPDYYCSGDGDTYLPVLEIFACMGNDVETLEISAVAEKFGFFDGVGLKEIRVAEGNARYAAKDGVLYNKTFTELIAYPRAKESTSFAVPAGVTKICAYAFGENTGLEKVEIPASVEIIEKNAFLACKTLTAIEFSRGSALKSIGERAFWNCVSLQTIEIPARVETIDFCAFNYCNSLKTVEFAENSALRSIVADAFYGCKSLQSIEIPAGTAAIGSNAFAFCDQVKQIVIPATVEDMGKSVFAYWKHPQRICVPFEEDELPKGWSSAWSDEMSDQSIIEYGYKGDQNISAAEA